MRHILLDGVTTVYNVIVRHVTFVTMICRFVVFLVLTVQSNPCLPCRQTPKANANSKSKQSSPSKR